MPEPDPVRCRSAVLDQLRYLIDEIAALRQVSLRLHEPQITNTDRGPSVKQCYGAIVTRDRNQILPALKNISGRKDTPKALSVDWNSVPMKDILAQVESARRSVIQAAENLSMEAWSQQITEGMDVCQFLLTASQHDTDTLRTVAERLYRTW
jgi:hypothetical protein